ncbi:MAG: hypothetical protein KDD62_13935 [Bdellovibrionales bacterium]|nr:hypothetical protein [Bdellovibrionales bacterium]
MSEELALIKDDIIAALSHVEAEDGLYLNNLQVVHEEEERPIVRGTQLQILDALKELIDEGRVVTNEEGSDIIFMLKA